MPGYVVLLDGQETGKFFKLWIAAHAKAAKLILVTNNEREFQRVSGLEIQNWAKSEGPTLR